jgi:hypothetical protein
VTTQSTHCVTSPNFDTASPSQTRTLPSLWHTRSEAVKAPRETKVTRYELETPQNKANEVLVCFLERARTLYAGLQSDGSLHVQPAEMSVAPDLLTASTPRVAKSRRCISLGIRWCAHSTSMHVENPRRSWANVVFEGTTPRRIEFGASQDQSHPRFRDIEVQPMLHASFPAGEI